jgi:hypothetical protein
MDFKDNVKQIAEKADKIKENLQTEEATKTALIMPFIQALGYDVFNPLEVIPEFVCDIGTKKGEKIDYAIMREGKPIILIECKHWKQDLVLHDNQLLRYFHVSNAKFGVLTNGITYKFYTDLETPNKMDEKPFLEIDITDIKNSEIEEVKKFHKTYFDVENILSSANELKYTRELKEVISKEFTNPSPEFVKLIAKRVHEGIITPKLLEQFTVLVKKSAIGLINDAISDRLKSALKTETSEIEIQPITTNEKEAAESESESESRIVTTAEELEGFYIVKSILRPYIAGDRITYRDTISYFGILVDDNNRKPICRLYFNSAEHKRIAFIGDDKKETRLSVKSLDDIYKYSEQLIEAVAKYTVNQTEPKN